ncbi:MAG: hypothetical protein N2746_09270 [Deltaproteobacteria bacterium]|nr:hypothetical protein [Deltaproteobacteria bacterium]
MRKTISLFVLLLMFTSYVYAQEPGPGDKIVYKQKTIIDFSDVTIQGELKKPDGSYISSRKEAQFGRLIKVRENFEPELFKSVDKL